MSAVVLLQTLRERDVRLRLESGQLRYDAPPGTYTEALRAQVREHKLALIALLAAPVCPTCSAPGMRLGTFRLEDGRGRFACSPCDIVWWAPIENPGDVAAVPGVWWGPYADSLTDARYEAVVSWDILHHGYHVGNRQYKEPTESPEAIWARQAVNS